MGDDQMTGDEVATALGRILAAAIADEDVEQGGQALPPRQPCLRVELSGVSFSVTRITLDVSFESDD